jgi:ADP-heptose:LPS heptosyltransferase
MRFFAYFIRFCTRSRFVGLTSLCGFSSPVGPKQSATFLGKGNYLDARVDTQLFYEQANNLLEFLGYKKVDRVPTLTFQEDTAVFSKFALTKGGYIVFHLVASSEDKSLPTDRWNRIIQEVRDKHPEYAIVFTGAKNDYKFVKECLGDIPESDIVNACGDVGMAGLLTLYKNAKVTVSVHTGNAILVNMLHVPTVMVNMRGVYMFKYHYNKKSIDCTGVEGCTCNPLERHCAMTPYKGKEYMACVFSNNDALILEQITTLCR